MTVWIYVDTSTQVGDKGNLKVFARGIGPRRRKNDARGLQSIPVCCGSNELTCEAGQGWLQPVS
jgi:hypothetical protein